MAARKSIVQSLMFAGGLVAFGSGGSTTALAGEPDAAAAQVAKAPPVADTSVADSGDLWGAYLHASLYSKYVFRGLTLYDGASFQPSFGGYFDLGNYGRIGAGIWMHVPLESGEEDTLDLTGLDPNIDPLFEPNVKFFELDPTISYDVSFDIVTLSAGHTWYTDPEKGEMDVIIPVRDVDGNIVDAQLFGLQTSRGDTAEFYIGVSVDTLLQPEFTFVHDYRRYDYEYYTFGVSHSFTASEEHNWTVTPYARFGWSTGNDANLDGDATSTSGFYTKNGLVNIDVGVSTEIQIDDFNVKPSANYVFVNDDSFGQDDIFWLGVDFDFSI